MNLSGTTYMRKRPRMASEFEASGLQTSGSRGNQAKSMNISWEMTVSSHAP